MGALDDGASCREYLEGAIKRDDINWELKSSIRLIVDEYDRVNTAFGCECEKSAKLRSELEGSQRSMLEFEKEADENHEETKQARKENEKLQGTVRYLESAVDALDDKPARDCIEDAMAHYRAQAEPGSDVAIEMARLLVGGKK